MNSDPPFLLPSSLTLFPLSFPLSFSSLLPFSLPSFFLSLFFFLPSSFLSSLSYLSFFLLPSLPLSPPSPVSSLVGWLRSPFLCTHTSISAAVASPTLSHFTAVALLSSWKSDSENGRPVVKRVRIFTAKCISVHNIDLLYTDKCPYMYIVCIHALYMFHN